MTKLSNAAIRKALIELNDWRNKVDNVLDSYLYFTDKISSRGDLDDVRSGLAIEIQHLEEVIGSILETRVSRLERIIEDITGKKIFLVDEEEK